MSKLRQLKEKRAALYSQVCELRNQADGREMTAEERANWDKLVADVDSADADIAKEEKFLELEKRNSVVTESRREETRDIEARAFAKFLMGANLTEQEARALQPEQREGIAGVTGSALVPTAISNYIEAALGNGTEFLSAIDMFTTTGGGDLVVPTINDTDSRAKIVAAYEKSEKNSKAFGSLTFKAYTYRTPIIPISYEMLQDSAFNLEQEIGKLLSEQFSRGLNYDFTNGSTGSEIKGIVTEATAVNAGSDAITYDALMDLEASL